MCYAVQLAFDSATDPVYADGWQAADNGGTGFTAWNFDGSYNSTDQHSIDTAPFGTYNDLGTAWKISNSLVDSSNKDIARAGRGFAPLQVGQTLRVIVDSPNDRLFFRGYFVRFNSGIGNICYSGTPCTPGTSPISKFNIRTFEYFTYGQWGVEDGDGFNSIPLFDTDTDNGVQIDLKMTGTDAYQLTMDPIGPGNTFTKSGSFEAPGEPLDWIEFTFFNSQTDPGLATDFYIKSLEIFDDASAGVPGDYSSNDDVDAADFTIWRDHLNSNFQLANEVSGVTPGSVTTEDYDAWKTRFNDPPGAASIAVGAPEPGTLAGMLVAGVIYVGLWPRGGTSHGVHPKKLD